jgi:8-oxo-dGTP pyrophosphatase MutT (NUDIX family)
MGDRNRNRHRKVRRAAGCVVYTGGPEQRRFLLIRDPYERWTLPKGHLEGAEDDQAAAVREVQEETGISGDLGPHIGMIIYSFYHHGQPIEKRVTFFLMQVDGSTKTTPQTSEGISEVAWFPAEQARRMISYDQVRGIFDKAVGMLEVDPRPKTQDPR